ncbi:MAG: hypothetical protein JWP89_5783, partial [Schlesneria sp.]|nr:hypothetical protein [Schlesneria sp.]
SWLNMAEMELSVLSRQCLGSRRFATAQSLDTAITQWQSQRNSSGQQTRWRFTTADARIKLTSLYPVPIRLPDIGR